ncbi:MAG: hypothetical protein IPJ58_05025 [Ardenticatenia bacterium]|nr:hypothetical protein [Ardenticatenia bacterium]
MPQTRPGRASPAAMRATDSVEVFVASTASGEATASTALNSDCLMPMSSGAASITRPQGAKSAVLVVPVTRAMAAAAATSSSLPLSASRWIAAAKVLRPRCT